MKKKTKKYRYRSSKTGRYVTAKFSVKHRATTEKERAVTAKEINRMERILDGKHKVLVLLKKELDSIEKENRELKTRIAKLKK